MPITITMPALSPTMTEGTLAKWLIKEGDSVQSGDILAEIETDKATMEYECIDEGTVGRLLIDEGTEGVAVNQPIAILLEDGEDESAIDEAEANASPSPEKSDDNGDAAEEETSKSKSKSSEKTSSKESSSEKAEPAPAAPKNAEGDRIFASPLARRMAAQAGLDLASLSGSGPNGRIVKADIEKAVAEGTGKKAAAAKSEDKKAAAGGKSEAEKPAAATDNPFEPEYTLESLSQMRKTIARRMTESKQQVPHFYLTIECELDALLDLRKQLNARGGDGVKISVNDMVVKASALALKRVPKANVAYSSDGIRVYHDTDIAVAVASERGLITPVVRKASEKGLKTISDETKELAAKARDGKLKPEEFQGGTFTISNLGMFGIKQFDAVINTPQACILAVGAGEKRPVVKDDALAIATVMSCTLSVDHRAVDGSLGAQYLQAFKALIEDPLQMML